MKDKGIVDESDPLGADYTFKYYLLGNTVPIRVLYSKSNGLKAGHKYRTGEKVGSYLLIST